MLWEELTAKEFENAAAKCGGVCVLPLAWWKSTATIYRSAPI